MAGGWGYIPGGPVVKNPCLHSSIPGWGTRISYAVRRGREGWNGGREGGGKEEEENSVERWKLCPGNQTYFGISPGFNSNFAPALLGGIWDVP